MEDPKPLDSIFKEKIFRIPDYQRGYAWQKSQLKDFWEDLVNLSDDRSHYTGVLTLRPFKKEEIRAHDKEYWLIDDHSYKAYHIVDGQQRLATFVIFIQAFIEFVRQISDNAGKTDDQIYISESLNLSSIIEKYLYKIKPTGDQFRTYKFGYSIDNPSYEYLRYRIFNESGAGSIEETFYTLNLKNAKQYFYEQLNQFYSQEGIKGLEDVYKKLTKRFLFNEFVIKDDFDVFVAFETMNNRGKKLSDLELLKNRLIYLTTLFDKEEIDLAERTSLRDAINNSWKEVYHQLGRNEKHPLNDDDFLKAHWIMYFKYSRKRGNDYIKFLLDEEFTPHRIHKKIERDVSLESPEEIRTEFDVNNVEKEIEETQEDTSTIESNLLAPIEIKKYVDSLKESAVYWFYSHYPELSNELSEDEKNTLDTLNRIGMGYFRPLVMSVLKNEKNSDERINFFKEIERFIFIVFRLCQARSNYRDSEFYNAARELDKEELDLNDIRSKLNDSSSFAFREDGTFEIRDFYNYLYKKFHDGDKNGFYGWYGLRYFLYEYELSLLQESRQKKVSWVDLLKSVKDKVSIEHIFPLTPTDYWKEKFNDIPQDQFNFYSNSLGNLLLLSMSINSALQNDSFEEKKNPKYDESGQKERNGYSDGSHSEIKVSEYPKWGSTEIKQRGIELLNFMGTRWNLRFCNDDEKEQLLFLKFDEVSRSS